MDSLNVIGKITQAEFKTQLDRITHIMITIKDGMHEDELEKLIEEGKSIGVQSIYLKEQKAVIQFICSDEDFLSIKLQHNGQSTQEIYDFYAKKEHYTVGE